MTLYEKWIQQAYNKQGESNKTFWTTFLPQEQKIYEDILKNKINILEGTLKELSAKYHMTTFCICGFVDGINDALQSPIDVENLTEDQYIKLIIDFEVLYKKMVEYKAEHLYNLEEWDNVFSKEHRKSLYMEQKTSKTVLKSSKIGRNSLCPCGSNIKYKKCCGAVKNDDDQI